MTVDEIKRVCVLRRHSDFERAYRLLQVMICEAVSCRGWSYTGDGLLLRFDGEYPSLRVGSTGSDAYVRLTR